MRNLKLKNKQSGAALAIGMILLLIISVIAMTSMKSGMLQERMAAGLKNRELADAAAMSLLVEIERYLYSYYELNNGTTLDLGSDYMVTPRGSYAIDFRNQRGLSGGYANVGGVSINTQYGGVLAAEPRFIIEPINSGSQGSAGTISFGDTDAEDDDASAGGSNPDDGAKSSQELMKYRIVSKATDTTGHLFSAFESVISVMVR